MRYIDEDGVLVTVYQPNEGRRSLLRVCHKWVA